MAPPPVLPPRYEPIRELGAGGFARVFLVRDLHLRRELALKLLHDPPLTAHDLEQARREFALLAEIEHPGIARAHDFGYLGERPFFTSEFIPGEPLSARTAAWTGPELLRLASDLADALAFLHRHGILHLDVKPSNVIASTSPDRRRAVLIDFGLVRTPGAAVPGASVRGSLPYMAPEYFRGGDLGPPADIYALGVTLYRAATGRFPRNVAAEPPGGLESLSAWEAAPRRPSSISAECPRGLDGLILRCLALDPAARFASGAELLAALEACGGRPIAGRQAQVTTTLGRGPELARSDELLDGLLGAPRGRSARAAILVTGPPGIGQSHLLRAIKVRAQTRGLRCYLEVGYPGRSEPPGSILRCLGPHLADAAGAPGARERWERFLAGLRATRRPFRSEVTDGERRLRRAGEVSLAARCIREPVVLAIDGLQHCGEVSIELVTHLVRFLGELSPEERPSLGIVVAYREEGPSAPLLRELTEYLTQPGKGSVLELAPLGRADSIRLYESRGGDASDLRRGLELVQRTGGRPRAIVGLARPERPAVDAGRGPVAARRGDAPDPDPARDAAAGRRPDAEAGVVLALEILDRPAAASELARAAGRPLREVRVALAALEREGAVARVDPDADPAEWILESKPAARRRTTPAERRRVHRRIAEDLARRAARRGDPRLVEAVRHFRAAGRKAAVVRHGLRAAAYLKANHQHRAALDLYREVLSALPASRRRARLEVALEIADLHARIGESSVDDGIRVLRDVLPWAKSLEGPARRRVLLRLATLHGRRGDLERAEALFSEGLAGAEGAGLGREELLLFTNEHAALECIVGRHREARELCEKGLRLAGKDRSPDIREIVLNLHATRANIGLRSFDLDAAIGDLRRAAEIAESIGSPGNQAAVLNNLGVVYNHADRYPEALRAFQEAEQASLRLDEGPSLASTYGNLAILHAKLGDHEASERALEAGDKVVPAVIGRRQRFVLGHARAVCLLCRGRYEEALRCLRSVVELGEALGDRHVVAHDEAYRAEALVMAGRRAEAEEELRRLAASAPHLVRRIALARWAYLDALLGRADAAAERERLRSEIERPRPVPYLEAWDAVFLGWAFSILGDEERSAPWLAAAGEFFESHRLEPALVLVRWIQAEGRFLRGDPAGAGTILGSLHGAPGSPRGNDLTAVLIPILEARILMDASSAPADRARSADRLAAAAAALASNPLPEWSARLDALWAHLRPAAEAIGSSAGPAAREAGAGPAPEAPGPIEAGPYWRAWTAPPAAGPHALPAAPAPPAGGSAGTGTVVLGIARRRLVARSSGMRRLVEALDRIRGADLPVLVRGETGTGKELVARIVHEESPRAAGPFRVIDCATIPAPLLESELFGARAGAFTGIEQDRPGLLSLAAGGTVLIDEIAGAGLDVQSKLLRVLEAGQVRPVGAEEGVKVDVRFLFSSSRDLEREVRDGRFRGDLYHRIRVLELRVPPLRDRPEDVEDLARALLAEGGRPAPAIDPGAADALRRMSWPGNVRELRNFLSRLRLECPERIGAEAVIRAEEDSRTRTLFPRNLLAGDSLEALQERLERDYVAYHFRRLGRDSEALARFLGLSRRQLYRRCGRLGILLRSL